MKRILDKDTQFIEGLKNGDEQAYVELIEIYHNRLCSYANSLLNDVSFSEDIVQNVFIKLWEGRSKLKPDISLKSYLFKSVYNGCMNQYKKNLSMSNLERKYTEGLANIMERDNDAIEKLVGKVKDAIQKLPPKCKEIFLLSKKEGLTNKEIADYLNMSKKTIENQITIAFAKIREHVGNKADILLFLLYSSQGNLSSKIYPSS